MLDDGLRAEPCNPFLLKDRSQAHRIMKNEGRRVPSSQQLRQLVLRGKTGYPRLLGIACLLTFVATGLTGCDLTFLTPETAPTSPAPTSTSEPEPLETPEPDVTTVVFWEPFALDRPQGLLLGEMVRDFEAENPDIDVEIVAKSGYEGIHGAMQAQLPGGELPNLAVAFPSMIAEYAAAGVVLPLDAYLGDSDLGLTGDDLADIFPGYLEAGRFPGFGRQTLAFPFSQNAIGLWVNETLLQQAGWEHAPATWAEFEQACFDVVATSGARCYPFVESVSTLNAWLYSRGGRQLDAPGRHAAFNDLAGIESLALLKRLIDAGLAWRPDEPFGDYVAFANGQAAFTFSSTGNSQLYLDAYDGALRNGVAPFRWRQTIIPQADPENPATALYGASIFILKSDPIQQEAAWRFIRWFTDARQTARWAGDLQSMPVRLSALDWMTDTLEAYPFFEAQVEEILPYGRPEPAVAAELEIRDILYTAILSVTQGYLDPQTALDQAAREANGILSGQP
jgi:multiple sugar transport system substrate-binding protein